MQIKREKKLKNEINTQKWDVENLKTEGKQEECKEEINKVNEITKSDDEDMEEVGDSVKQVIGKADDDKAIGNKDRKSKRNGIMRDVEQRRKNSCSKMDWK